MAIPATRIACGSTRSIPLWARTFHSSCSSSAAKGKSDTPSAAIQKERAKVEKETKLPLMQNWKVYDYSEPPFLETVKMLEVQETWNLVEKLRENDALLRAQATPFTPPTNSVRLTRFIVPGAPNHPSSLRQQIVVPVSSLPLNTSEARHRIKLLAGSRWNPGRTDVDPCSIHANEGFNAGPQNIGKEGWLIISCDKFPEPRMNRKFVSDTLERLVEAANDPNSPLSTDIPIDTRHLKSARRSKKYGESKMRAIKTLESLKMQNVGGVRGFPVEWLSDEALSKPKYKKAMEQ
ncbi:mitochondrial ribosomal subunit protein-domain-containing protein [Kockovaella imperatae]|uniref:Mitochondrial ribosomal subunit protein-domain-containing protein n=1 Tax=Kockovaella imperatae TaxID=4999 RepID=A0A1Y1USE0_9TREE|nr:mitochondrial ribosomal subunit protein-domain-containing protein [Kockovaella imperatae]ORX40938.1 mitochondrial ribosomal subunit protein-domain-containing protein [Kockovaella imperatae]